MRNKAVPEGSIAEGYVAEELLTFVRAIWNPRKRYSIDHSETLTMLEERSRVLVLMKNRGFRHIDTYSSTLMISFHFADELYCFLFVRFKESLNDDDVIVT
jgi:hypothetical protein